MHDTLTSLEQVPLFKSLSSPELDAIKQCFSVKKFSKGETLFIEGDGCSKVFFLKSGRIKICRISQNGREQILETLGPGDTCACNPGNEKWKCSTTATAATECQAWFLSREHYVQLVRENAKLSRALNHLFANRLQCFSALIEDISLKDSRHRLIKFILDMMDENPGKNALSLPFTREELAQRLGVARETVARQLHQLKDQKLIDIKPRQILIRDRQALKNLL